MDKIRLGISSCLMGNPVRYDGQHKLDRYLRDELGRIVEWIPICPEVDCGMTVPRESMHLEGSASSPRLVTLRSRVDLTEKMNSWIGGCLDSLAAQDIEGFVFKSQSPSSGLYDVRIYSEKGMPRKEGQGFFAGAFVKRFPMLPVEEEGRLNDLGLRQCFLDSVFTLHRWREYVREDKTVSGLTSFQAKHKYMLMAHSPSLYSKLGQIAGNSTKHNIDESLLEYHDLLVRILRTVPTVKKHSNVLLHMLGYFKKNLESWEKQEVLSAVSEYTQGLVTFEVPAVLIQHYARKYNCAYLANQYYWEILLPVYRHSIRLPG